MISNLDIFDGFVVLQPKKINNLDLHCLKVKMRTRGIHKLHLVTMNLVRYKNETFLQIVTQE